MIFVLVLCTLLALPIPASAEPLNSFGPPRPDLIHHASGYLSLLIAASAYFVALSEETTALRKSKPMVLASALIWFAICFYYAANGQGKMAALAFESYLLTYIELFLFFLVSMTYLNTMEECGVFRTAQIFLLSKRFSYRTLFWLTGMLAFLLSTAVSGLTVALLMGTVIMLVGKRNPEFISVACVNVVCAANAGGSFSPLGGVSTLLIWQHKMLPFHHFFLLAIPCLINYLLPAAIMSFQVPSGKPVAVKDFVLLKRGTKRILFLFATTLIITVAANTMLELPPAAGMMAGLGLLQFFNFYLSKTATRKIEEKQARNLDKFDMLTLDDPKGFDVFRNIGNIDWDTLLFFYGTMMIIGALSFIGYLNAIAHFLFGQISPAMAAIDIGLASAFIDNGTLMFAVLNMRPAIVPGEWLLLTLALGTGGSLLAIGSAPGVGLLGRTKGHYTFKSHLRWLPVLLLGYLASIAVSLWMNLLYF